MILWDKNRFGDKESTATAAILQLVHQTAIILTIDKPGFETEMTTTKTSIPRISAVRWLFFSVEFLESLDPTSTKISLYISSSVSSYEKKESKN